MKIIIAAVGKMKKGPEAELLEAYKKRLPWDIVIKEIEEKRPLPAEKLKDSEASQLLSSLPESSFKIALDERGKQLGSRQLAEKLRGWLEGGAPVTFLIGGAAGHGRKIAEEANFTLSLGSLTWPHMLVRVMLMEQLYRSSTIISGHPYHKD